MRQLIAALLLTAPTLFFSGCAYDEPRGDRGYGNDSRVERRDDSDNRRVGRPDDRDQDRTERRNDR